MIFSADVESELLRVWNLINELSEQLQENRAVTANLRDQAERLKAKAVHSGTGYPLRRFNMDMTKETFDEEMEKFYNQISVENQALANDNRQLGALVKEYEQTLESVMHKFRVHAHSSQEHELALTRQYEQQLLSRESSTLAHELEETQRISLSLARISDCLRRALRANGGEAPSHNDPLSGDDAFLLETDDDAVALERECELVRLEKENEELRALLELRDSKDMTSLRDEIAQETRDAYARRAGSSLENPYNTTGIEQDVRNSRMFSAPGFRGLNRGGKRGGLPGRGKTRIYGVQHSGGWA